MFCVVFLLFSCNLLGLTIFYVVQSVKSCYVVLHYTILYHLTYLLYFFMISYCVQLCYLILYVLVISCIISHYRPLSFVVVINNFIL